MRIRNMIIFIVLIISMIFIFLVCVVFGFVKIEFKEVIDVVLRGMDNIEYYKIIYNIRIFRVFVIMVGGVCLVVLGILL